MEVVTADAALLREAESRIEGCEHCHLDDAEIPFDWILGEVTKNSCRVVYVMAEVARCPTCRHEVTEKTLTEAR